MERAPGVPGPHGRERRRAGAHAAGAGPPAGQHPGLDALHLPALALRSGGGPGGAPGRPAPHTFEGSAWVSVTPFVMAAVRMPPAPPLPWLSTSPETDARTHMLDDRDRDGLWFLSLEAARLPVVPGLRTVYGLPYWWARMSVTARDGRVRHESRRRWPGRDGDRALVTIEPGAPADPRDLTDLDVFLTHRWRGFTMMPPGLAFTPVDHAPWPLRRARAHELDETLLAAAGLPPSGGPPVVHHSAGVRARLAAPGAPVRRPGASRSRATPRARRGPRRSGSARSACGRGPPAAPGTTACRRRRAPPPPAARSPTGRWSP